ncbi:hypothetical protein HDU85_002618 [Gaertneriomyces sp. JEL0708]|nr:hypothetical protein HDU85_002618 [Gaertneriomyces sp. JEL0708]
MSGEVNGVFNNAPPERYIHQINYPPPSSTATPNSNSRLPEPHITPQMYARALSRIETLEKTIEFVNGQHSSILKGLHDEIGRLQQRCSDLSVKLVTVNVSGEFEGVVQNEATSVATMSSESLSASLDSLPEQTENKLEADQESEATHDASSVDIGQPSPSLSPPASSSSFSRPQSQQYLSLQLLRQRQKYFKTLSRLHSENKRRQSEIDHLRAERELVKEGLAIVGCRSDLEELVRLAGAAKVAVTRVEAKIAVLPPIGSTRSLSDVPRNVHGSTGSFKVPVPPATMSTVPRPSSSRSRGLKLLAQHSELDASSGSRASIPYRSASDFGSTELLPAIDPSSRLLPSLDNDRTDHDRDAPPPNTSWFKRVQGTKLVREKHWREMNLN